MRDKHMRCQECGVNAQGSPGAASASVVVLAHDHAVRTGHRVELWDRGDRENAEWVQYRELSRLRREGR